jgi:hypothetical protein
MSVNDLQRHQSKTVVAESYPILGYNYRLTDVQAAIGLAQLRRLDGIIARRRAIAPPTTRALLAGMPGVACSPSPRTCAGTTRPTSSASRGDGGRARRLHAAAPRGRDRDPAGDHVDPPGACYVERFGRQSFPESERASDQCVCLPLYTQMDDADIETVWPPPCAGTPQAPDHGCPPPSPFPPTPTTLLLDHRQALDRRGHLDRGLHAHRRPGRPQDRQGLQHQLRRADPFPFHGSALRDRGAHAEVDRKPTEVGDFVFVGANAVVQMGARIGDHSVIGAGAVVLEDAVIPPTRSSSACPRASCGTSAARWTPGAAAAR